MADSDGVVMVRWRRNWSVSKIGLPEVDTIMDGDRFRNFPVFSLAASKSAQVRNKITDTRRRRTLARCKVSNDNVDHISRLPDAVLQFIISLLTMREAAATTILSTRWRSLWTSSFSCLEFDIPNMLGYDYPNIMFENESQGYLMEKRSNFTTWVNQVMQLCLAQRLDALRVSFILDRHSASHIDKWIMSAVAQGATDIFLDFHYERFYGRLHDPHELYQFPTQDFVSKLKYLQLKSCKLHLEPSFTGFTSLITLSLTAVHISQSLMENILSKCPLLEFLTLNNCYHPSSTNFKFAGPSLRLKHLRIGNNYDITKIELHGINLLSFELGISKASVSIKDTPHLTRLVLLTRLKPVEILSNTPRLETLFLHQKVEGNGVVSQFDIFKNLRRLVFIPHCDTTNLLGVVRILSACLLLEKLELDMGISEESSTINGNSMIVEQLTALPEISLENLKEIEIYGFQAYPEKIELAKYLLKNAIVLQKMDIYTMTRMYCGNGRWRHRDDTSKMHSMILREEVHRLYQNAAHSSAKVRLFSSAN